MSLLFVCFLWFVGTPFVDGTDCPNDAFTFVAEYRGMFTLNKGEGTGRYWVAFGSNGAWTVNLVDAIFGGSPQTFKCKEVYWGQAKEIEVTLEEDTPICCVAPHEIDDNGEGETRPFAVLPQRAFVKFPSGYRAPTEKTAWKEEYGESLHWVLSLFGHRGRAARRAGRIGESISRHALFYGWIPIKVSADKYGDLKDAYGTDIGFFQPLDTPMSECAQKVPICDTGITSHIVAFNVECEGYSYVKFGFKSDGMFDVTHFICWAELEVPTLISYYPVSKLFRKGRAPSYNSLRLGWRLGSFCASCPSTSFKKMISEKEAKMNKKRLQHSLAISAGRSFIGKRLGINVKYVRTWFKEAAETLTSGSATTISATCNGFYLWYWTVSVGTWGEGNAAVPTQFFYCTDRTTPPICKPNIAGMESGGEFGKLCDGHDVDADFIEGSHNTLDRWQSMHSGRPKPVRLQGQRFNEPGFYMADEKPKKRPPPKMSEIVESQDYRSGPPGVRRARTVHAGSTFLERSAKPLREKASMSMAKPGRHVRSRKKRERQPKAHGKKRERPSDVATDKTLGIGPQMAAHSADSAFLHRIKRD